MNSEQCPIQVEYSNFGDIPILYIVFIVFFIAYALAVNRIDFTFVIFKSRIGAVPMCIYRSLFEFPARHNGSGFF